MLRKSAKFMFVEGVCRPNDGKDPAPPGVDIIDDGSGVDFGGGVDGATMRGLESDIYRAGDGDVAKDMSRLASWSPFWLSRAAPAALKPLWRRRRDRPPKGGVRGSLGGVEGRCVV